MVHTITYNYIKFQPRGMEEENKIIIKLIKANLIYLYINHMLTSNLNNFYY